MDNRHDEWMTRKEVCAYARISESTLHRLTRQGRLKRYRIPVRGRRFLGGVRRGKVLYCRAEVEAFLRRCQV